jgi:hypothetical protein
MDQVKPETDRADHQIEFTILKGNETNRIEMKLDGKKCEPTAVITLAMFQDTQGREGLSMAAGGHSEEAMVALLASSFYSSPPLTALLMKALNLIEEQVRQERAQAARPPALERPASAADRPGFYI